MARKWSLFDFMNKKVLDSEITPVEEAILEQIAFKELALYIGISYIANTLSKCEFKTYEKGVEVQNELYYMLNISPNPNENSSQFINKMIENYFYKGHSLVVPQGANIYCADDFVIDDSNPLKEYIFSNIAFNTHTMQKKFKSSKIFYFKLDNRNVKNLVDSLYMQYGLIISQALESYKKTNGEKYKLILEQYQAGDKKFKEIYDKILKNQLKEYTTSANGVYVQYKGMDLQKQDSEGVKDTGDVISMRKEIFEVTAQALKIPLPMMYGNITNMNEITKVYLSICIDPIADMISEEITRKQYTYEEWKAGNYVKVDTSCINHVDILEVADKIYNAIGSGVANIDDMRKRLGWNQLDTDFGKQFFISKNFDKIEDVMNGTTKQSVKGGANNE